MTTSDNPTPAPDAVSVAIAAKRLGVCPRTIYRATWAGSLPFVRIGNSVRVLSTSIEDVLAGRIRLRTRRTAEGGAT